MVKEDDRGALKVGKDGEIFSIVDEKESGKLEKVRFKRRKYSRRFERAALDGPKTSRYTIKLYDSEYEVLKIQCHQLNITIQLLIDFLLLDGFIKRDARVIDFLNEKIQNEVVDEDRKFNKIEQFSNLEIHELISKIENVEESSGK